MSKGHYSYDKFLNRKNISAYRHWEKQVLANHTFPRPACTIAVLSFLKSIRPDFVALTVDATSFVTDPIYINEK